ncbi:hypothetical protein LSH36_326g02070 [Paralvinella palmiformis]|uniref:RNA polymerase II-associated protein 1 n=1 Tax=Paralvinella palmiformis TaxID=53620 RepID=A0AAD9JGU5_9ANNE|nr:hypothetical protein LSH36_326g02070 [Paralvinella palmiformis]
MFKRPSPADTDEDLEKFQEQFLASRSQPAAKLIKFKDANAGIPGEKTHFTEPKPSTSSGIATNKDVVSLGDLPAQKPPTAVVPPLKRSRFKRSRIENQNECVADVDPEIELDRHDSHITRVLTEIIEREFDAMPPYSPSGNVIGGFPKVLHRGDVKQTKPGEQGRKGRSLFAQQFARCPATDFGLPSQQNMAPLPLAGVQNNTALRSRVTERCTDHAMNEVDPVVVTNEIEQIDMENKARLESMTNDEILREQKTLLETLDPNVVSFLRSRSHMSQHHVRPSQPETENQQHASHRCTGTDSTADNSCSATKSTAGEGMKVDDNDMDVESTLSNEKIALMLESESGLKPPNNWLHMDKLEPEKLEWMRDLPQPTSDDNTTGKPARFDLNGALVNTNANIPMHLGLHHHADEPERGGYTLGELFHLSRSANIQQRALALNILAKVTRKAREGRFHGCVSAALVPAMVEGGLVFILRWALDDKTDNTMTAAVNALHALLVIPADELGLDRTLSWYKGHEVPCLCPEPVKVDDLDQKPSDAELVRSDMVKGLLQMSLLPRLRYILEVWQPHRITVVQILDILIRFCRHSTQLAYEVFKCPRLLDTVFRKFLTWKIPETWPDPLVTAYEFPCSRALKLVRVLSMASKNMASHIVSNYALMDCLLLYISQGQQQQVDGRHPELCELIVESYRTWKICVIYGLGARHYRDCYPMLIEQLKTSCQLDYNSSPHSLQLGCTVISFLESVVHAAAKNTHLLINQRQKSGLDIGSEIEHTEALFIPDLDWSHVTGLGEPLIVCLQRQLDELRCKYVDEKYDLSLIACCLNFLASWLERVPKMPKQDIVDIMDEMKSFCRGSLIPVLRSRSFSSVVAAIRKHSVIIGPVTDKNGEPLTSLPDLGSLMADKDTQCPVLEQGSTIHFVLAFVRLCYAMRMLKSDIADVCAALLHESELLQYLRQLCHANRAPHAKDYFAQFENRLQLVLVNLALCDQNGLDVALYHQVALNLLTHLHEGSECDVHHLLSMAIFNQDLLGDLQTATDPSLAISLSDHLQLQKPAKIVSASEEEIIIDKTQLLSDLSKNLISIRNTYLTAFGGRDRAVEQSKRRCEDSLRFPETLMLGRCGELLVPVDWVFLPLIEIYNGTCNMSEKRANERSYLPDSIATVTNSMRFIYFIEEYRSERLQLISYAVRLSRLVCVFMAGSDLFLDSGVQSYLAALLQHYSKPAILDRMHFNQPVPGLASFYDLYVMLLEQFGAVSFGDWLFSSYVLLPLQQRHDIMFRRAVWGEFSAVLHSLRLNITQIMVPLERFLEPEETELELLRMYFEALLSQAVTAGRTPLPYLIAVHHVNRFVFNQQHKHKKMAHAMMKHAIRMPDGTLQRHLLYYKLANKEKEHGMELYTVLPPQRHALIDSFRLS